MTRDRLKQLRAELKRAGLTGFIVPARRRAPERIPAALGRAPRLADRLHRLGRLGGRAARRGGGLRRRPLHAPGPRPRSTPSAFALEHLIETPPSKWLKARLKPGDRIGYDPWLMTRPRSAASTKSAAAAEATLVAGRGQPDRPHLDRPAGAAARRRSRSIRSTLAGEDAARQDRAPAGRDRREEGRRGGPDPGRTRSPGPSTSAARDIAHNPGRRSPSPSCPRRAGRRSSSTGGSSPTRVRAALADLADLREPADFAARSPRSAAKAAKVLLDPQGHACGDRRRDPRRRRHARRGRRPGRAAQGAEERRPSSPAPAAPTSATARRWCASSPGSTATAASGAIDEIAAAEKLARVPRRHRAARRLGAGRPLLRHDLRRRAERRHRPLPRDAARPTAGSSRARSTWSIPAASTATAPPTSRAPSRSARRPTEMRDRFTRVLKGHIAIATARFPVGATGAQLDTLARAALWQAGLDYDHGTGHGVGSFLSVHEGPARISKLGTRAARAGHDPLQRARLLQDRRLRHPHREPRRGHAAGDHRRRRPADARLRDADAGADRPAADRRRRCCRPTRSPGSTPTTRGSPRRSTACSTTAERHWLAEATAPLAK